jgi:hypothetical protein
MDDVTQPPNDEKNANETSEAGTHFPEMLEADASGMATVEPPPLYVRPARRKPEATATSPQATEPPSTIRLDPDKEDQSSPQALADTSEATEPEVIASDVSEASSTEAVTETERLGDTAVTVTEEATSDADSLHAGDLETATPDAVAEPHLAPQEAGPAPVVTTLPVTAPAADLPMVKLRKRWIALCFGLTFLVYVALVPNFLKYSSPPTGDQPFYLMVTISLVQDHDIDLANNYAAHDEDKFYSLAPRPEGFVGMGAPYPLPPHPAYTPARPPTEQYNFHLPGMSLMLVPAWVIGGWFSLWWPATVVFMCLIGALVVLNAFMLAYEVTGKIWIAVVVWLPIAFSNPIMTYSYLIFTELTTGLLLIYAVRRLAMGWGANGPWRLSLIGLCIGYIPWVAWRCLFITIPLALYAAIQWWRWWRHSRSSQAKSGQDKPVETKRRVSPIKMLLSAAYVFVPVAISAVGLAWYNIFLFGSLVPTTRTSEMGDQPLFFWPWTGIEGLTQFAGAGYGFLFDRMYGLLIYAPIYLLSAVGMIAMFRSGRKSDRRLLLAFGLVLLPYLGLMMSFFYWNGLWCPPARFMTTFAPLMAAPLAMSLFALSRSWTYKMLYGLLAIPGWISMAIMMKDARHMWPGYPVYEWLATSPEAPFHINLTNALPAIAPLDEKRLPGNSAWIAALSVGIVFFCYLLMLFQGIRSTRANARAKSLPNPWTRRKWPLLAHGLIWLVAISVISSGWYVMNREYIKPQTQLVEQARWILNPPVNGPRGVTYMNGKLYIVGYGEFAGPSVGELDLGTGVYRLISAVTPEGLPLLYTHPGDIKAGPDNLLYVLNNGLGNQALLVMQPDGKIVRQVNLDGKTPVATGLDIGPDNKLLIADMTGSNLRKYNLTGGEPVANWGGLAGGFNNIGSVTVGEDGTIYAAEISFQRVQKLAPDGTFLDKYDIRCTPAYIAINGDWLDISCDKGLISVNKKSGNIQQSNVVGNGPQLITPEGLVYGPDNTLYLLDGSTVIAFKVQH